MATTDLHTSSVRRATPRGSTWEVAECRRPSGHDRGRESTPTSRTTHVENSAVTDAGRSAARDCPNSRQGHGHAETDVRLGGWSELGRRLSQSDEGQWWVSLSVDVVQFFKIASVAKASPPLISHRPWQTSLEPPSILNPSLSSLRKSQPELTSSAAGWPPLTYSAVRHCPLEYVHCRHRSSMKQCCSHDDAEERSCPVGPRMWSEKLSQPEKLEPLRRRGARAKSRIVERNNGFYGAAISIPQNKVS